MKISKWWRSHWWVPMKKASNLDEQHLYEDCWNGKWKCNLIDLEWWLKILVVLSSFPTWKNTTNKSQINIPQSFAFWIRVNLEATNAFSNLQMMFMAWIEYRWFVNLFLFHLTKWFQYLWCIFHLLCVIVLFSEFS